MILRIGLDFDNTIANYDSAFPAVAKQLGINTSANNKRELKIELLGREKGEEIWQKVQGLTYGKFINSANLQPGLLEFVYRARAVGHEVFIVSHKTEFGHFDLSKTNLRSAALNWLMSKKVVGDSPTQINFKNVYFSENLDIKIEKINELNLDLFVDDLQEVFSHSLFSKNIKKILLASESKSDSDVVAISSWRDIGFEILGEPDSKQVLSVLNCSWPDLEIVSADKIVGKGNSKIFKVGSNVGDLVLKIYPDSAAGEQVRQKTEWAALELARQSKLQTPIPYRMNHDLNWTLIEWINGKPFESVTNSDIQRAADFVRSLVEISRPLSRNKSTDLATEACLSPSEVERQIVSRINLLASVNDQNLRDFIDLDVSPAFSGAVQSAQSAFGKNYFAEISPTQWILSPSDFGLHNAIKSDSNDIYFLDFEYFGWDDPVKLAADFCLHPAMSLSNEQRDYWISEMVSLFKDDISFEYRLNALLPLYLIRWTLIILNEFRTDKLKNRINAQDTIRLEVTRTQINQLEKAKLMLKTLNVLVK